MPPVTQGEILRLETLRPDQHFTEPPPRYSEATLVKELEDKGIGRPSTYASIISTIVEREYVNKDQGRFTPTMLGEKVSELLVKSFDDIFDVSFTARMEEELDEIEEGRLRWKDSVKEFYTRFEQDLEQAKGDMESYKAGIPTGSKCEKCGQGELLERISRLGFFLGCSRYPDCDFIEDLSPEPSGEGETETPTCDNCGREMVIKRGRWGSFLACSGYPDCKTTRRISCRDAAGAAAGRAAERELPGMRLATGDQARALRRIHRLHGYPKCKFIRAKTLGIKCPKCGTGELLERRAKKGRRRVFYGCNRYPECDFTIAAQAHCGALPEMRRSLYRGEAHQDGAREACLKEGCDWEIAAPEGEQKEAAPEEVTVGKP